MTPFTVTMLAAAVVAIAPPTGSEKPVYEMRTYYAPPGKLDALHARFREHTLKLFEKHGMTNIGYWVPVENPDNKLVYILAYPDLDGRKKSWAAFLADPDWKKAHAESEKDGKLVAKIESVFLTPTDYSPAVTPSKSEKSRVFELRTYTATPGNLAALNSRFRDHTVKLFEKHGMTNIGYWVPAPGQKGETDTLIYLLAHESSKARDQSFAAFRMDPAWTKARTASEEKAGGSLTAKDGVKSELLTATDYSPSR